MATEFVNKRGWRVVRPPRQSEVAARAKAFAAAREFLAGVGNIGEMAKKHGADRTSINAVQMILRFGTPEEIAAVEANEKPIVPTWRKIRPRVPEEALVRRTYRRSAEVKQVNQSDKQVFKKLKIAFDALSSMPSPPDVVAICRANRMRSGTIGPRVLTLQTWLEEFSDAWTK